MATYEMEQESNERHPGTFIAGLLVGGLAGAATLLLFAPQSGKDTRHQIKMKTIELRDRTTATVGNTMEKVKTRANQIKTGVSGKAVQLREQGKVVIAKQLDRVSDAAQNGKKAIQGKRS